MSITFPEPEYVRVKAKDNGHKFSMVRSAYEADKDNYDLLKGDAVDHNRLPLPPEFPASSGQKATDNTKES